ncbi:MAG TPA: hypothetical protein VGF50_09105 [Caulobacteraceae bacterium]|jgi:hypothetical protein
MDAGKVVVAALAALTPPGAAFAQHAGHGGHGGPPGGGHVGHMGGHFDGGRPGGHLAAGPIGRFGPHDMATWRAGYWWHGWRGGRVGWWWFAGGFWYWFAAPIHPYPSYVPDAFVAGGYPAAGAVWWYCDNPPGYYPYVQGCWRWRKVMASPPGS